MKPVLAFTGFILYLGGWSQTITMSNNCTNMLKQIESYNSAKMYDSALSVFPTFDKKCTAKDAKFKGNSAKAHAYNGLEKYDEALNASNVALKANPRWITAYFERAVAYAGKGQMAESKADYNKIIELSAKNQNTDARASIYAMLGDISFKQGQNDSAFAMLDSALKLKNDPVYFIQRGDMHYKLKDYNKAFADYDNAVLAGKADFEMYAIRSAQRLRIYQQKYGTDNVNELAKKMSADEKKLVCTELTKLKSFGRKNIKFDMTYTFLCE
jgi:tetratricopeptide (TPR) repeat protein